MQHERAVGRVAIVAVAHEVAGCQVHLDRAAAYHALRRAEGGLAHVRARPAPAAPGPQQRPRQQLRRHPPQQPERHELVLAQLRDAPRRGVRARPLARRRLSDRGRHRSLPHHQVPQRQVLQRRALPQRSAPRGARPRRTRPARRRAAAAAAPSAAAAARRAPSPRPSAGWCRSDRRTRPGSPRRARAARAPAQRPTRSRAATPSGSQAAVRPARRSPPDSTRNHVARTGAAGASRGASTLQ